MNVRAHIALDPADAPRQSAKVARVAELLDCDPGDVRRLLKTGELQGHGKGIRGVRVFLDSVRDYQDRKTKVPTAKPKTVIHKPKARPPASTAAYRAAVAGLAAKGLL